jgi:hypothetical protein
MYAIYVTEQLDHYTIGHPGVSRTAAISEINRDLVNWRVTSLAAASINLAPGNMEALC